MNNKTTQIKKVELRVDELEILLKLLNHEKEIIEMMKKENKSKPKFKAIFNKLSKIEKKLTVQGINLNT